MNDIESKSAGTSHGYRVEARLNYSKPGIINGQLFDQRWSEVSFAEAPVGVPVRGPYDYELARSNTYDYAAAQALRWWFHAAADVQHQGGCLETRIVKYKVKWECSWVAESAHAEIGGEDRSSLMPDWGQPQGKEKTRE